MASDTDAFDKGNPAVHDGYPMSDCMQNQSRAPKITALSWGRIATQAGVFRDAKLWPGGGRNWDWTETGTDHDVGLQLADFQELLDHAQGSSWSAGASTNAYRCPAEQSA